MNQVGKDYLNELKRLETLAKKDGTKKMNKIDEMLKNGSHYTAYITPPRSKRKEKRICFG